MEEDVEDEELSETIGQIIKVLESVTEWAMPWALCLAGQW